LSSAELSEYLARVDRGMDEIARGTILPQARADLSAATPARRAEVAREETLAKQGLRALLFTSAYHDLDQHSRRHPEVQRRLERWTPEVDEAVLGMTSTIASLSPERAAEVQRVLRGDPEIGLSLSEQLERQAKLLEVPVQRRLQMRSMLTHFAWRMRVQSPTVVAEEYLTKMHKVAALSGKTEELTRELATRLTDDAFWRYESLVAQADPMPDDEPGVAPHSAPASQPHSRPASASRPNTTTTPAPAESVPLPTVRPLEPEPKPNRGSGLLTGAGITAGIGAVVFGTGAGILYGAGSIAGAFMMTFGGIGVLVGLILLIVGAAIRS
jgi:hypothetical protein